MRAPQLEQQSDAKLLGLLSRAFERNRGGPHEVDVRHIGESRPTPKGQCLLDALEALCRLTLPVRTAHEAAEAVGVAVLGIDVQAVARAIARKRARRESCSKPRDLRERCR